MAATGCSTPIVLFMIAIGSSACTLLDPHEPPGSSSVTIEVPTPGPGEALQAFEEAPPAPVFTAAEYYETVDVADVAHASLADLCREELAQLTQSFAASSGASPTSSASSPASSATCREIRVPARLEPSATFLGVRAIRVTAGEHRYSSLIVVTPHGLVPGALYWDVEDPEDPGCPSIVRHVSIDELRVEHGRLLIFAAGERMTYVDAEDDDDDGLRVALVRTLTIATPEEGAIHFRRPEVTTGPSLGMKVQRAMTDRREPWAAIAWEDLPQVRLTPDGHIEIW
jgi:hypothetical protein